MDAIIKKYDLKKGTEALQEKMEEELSDWTSENLEGTVNKKMVLNALTVLQGKVCVADFPTEDSPAGSMAMTAFENISTCITFVIDENQGKPKEFFDPLLDFVLKLITCGPGTTHLKLIREVYGVSDFQDYCHTLKAEQVKKILTVCKREYKTKEKIDYEDYTSEVRNNMTYVLDDGFTDEQCVANRAEFLDLYMYFQFGFQDRKEEEREMMSNMAEWINRHFDSKPLQGVTDKAAYVVFLTRLQEMVMDKSFPRDTSAVDSIESGLSTFFEAINDAENIKDLYSEIIDFAAEIIDKKAGKPVHKLVEAVGYYFYHVEESLVKGKVKMFAGVCKKLTEIVEQAKDQTFLAIRFVDAVVSEVLVKAMGKTPDHVTLLINLIKALIKVPLMTTVGAAKTALSEQETALKWKEHVEEAKAIFVAVSQVKVPESDDREDILDAYTSFTGSFLDQIKIARVQDKIHDTMVVFLLGIVEKKNESLYSLGYGLVDRTEFDAKKDKDLLMKVFRAIDTALKDDSYPWLENTDFSGIINYLSQNAVSGIKAGNLLTKDDYSVLVSIVNRVVKKDFYHPYTGEPGSVYFSVYTTVAMAVLSKLDEINKMEWAAPMLGGIIDLLKHEDESVREMTGSMLQTVCIKSGLVLAPYVDKLVRSYFEDEKFYMLQPIVSIYPEKPGPINKEFQKFMAQYNTSDSLNKTYLVQLFTAVAKLHPEMFTERNLEDLWSNAKKDPTMAVQIIMVLEDVAKKHPEIVGKLLPLLAVHNDIVDYAKPSLMNVFKQVGVRSEKYAEAVLDLYVKILNGREEQTLFLCVLDGMRNVGGRHVPLLTKHRAVLEKVHARAQIQYTKDGITGLIDIMEGRSLAALSGDIKETQDDVKEIDTKVTDTQKNVKVVTKEVDKQKKEIKTVKKDVKTQGKKIVALEETVDETVAKVEEIDGKTLSHAPFWSRDVSKLLNPKGDHDWRLLSTRLGYNNDDIRGWAQQHDPCMALLNEWYATRKTSEASYAVLTALQEMNRMDAASIVENAMKMAETVVEDDPFEYASPPVVFISYQWGIQNEVKLLKRHLEMAGYECWMDIGQMGGGDKLFEKIDQGIRGSKVIISCVTPKYAKSPNCNREVNLSVSMGRPILPLLMEKQTWPPAGSMGPIFSEYLFIRFFTRPGEETGDDRYWSAAKFQELLMQLNYNGIVPDEAKVMKEYKRWWTPVVEDIKIDKKKAGSKGEKSQTTEATEVAVVSPDVFISYQWGKQKQIILLYRRLTSLGFSCWMDIHQMGGGDSLYDKIDRGVRGCKIILSCITTKYALSANCRREVSLADALKKPIVPLLLEKITWPPSGPMSMVFTQLLYINFSKDESVQEKWSGKEFDEMVDKINNHMPALTEGGTRKSEAEKSKTPPSGNGTSSKTQSNQPSKKNEKVTPVKTVPTPAPASAPAPASEKQPKPQNPTSDEKKSKSCTII
ncbi:uncharacterized protein LOC124131312 [Haliotis rufescens]|uniref:uncharacterized protein LOC124131312 n=1 Tax=Haliotis rufescens TaxID=6454 RepID=UPI00201EA793|nr:uncharacterized protein LOC124131312 [Haliotis rufescens]